MAAITLKADEPRSSQQPPRAATTLHLRRRGEAEIHTYPLLAAKFTIGSSPRCHVRLPASEAQPLQCLLTLEAGAATVTRWASGVLLNGREFSKAPLNDGDQLAIGDWELGLNGFAAAPLSSSPSPPAEAAVEPIAEVAVQSQPRPSAAGRAAPAPADSGSRPASASFRRQATHNCFGDRVVLQLWQANYQARQRVMSLLTALRSARAGSRQESVDGAQAAAGLEQALAQLDVAHAALADNERQLAEQLALHEQLEARLSECQAERDRLADAAAAGNATPAPESDDTLPQQAEAAQAALAAAEAELSQLRAELHGGQAQLDALREELAQSESQRLAAESELCEHAERADQASSVLESLREEHAAQCEQLQAQCDALREELATATSRAASAPEPLFPSHDDDPDEAAENAVSAGAFAAEPADWAAPPETSDLAEATDAPSAESFADQNVPETESPEPTALWTTASPTIEPSRDETPQAPEEPAAEVPAAESAEAAADDADFAPTSFIEKYKHLLNDADDEPALSTASSAQKILDEEFLPTPKVENAPAPEDDSDEALEAYMANMMRRVRGESAPVKPVAADWPPVEPMDFKADSSETTDAAELAEPSEPTEFLPMKHATRKSPVASDMATLREIANASARTAIASHHKRRNHESAIGIAIFAALATACSASLVSMAPSFDSAWFLSGAASGGIGLVAAVQALRVARRRDAARHQESAKKTAPAGLDPVETVAGEAAE